MRRDRRLHFPGSARAAEISLRPFRHLGSRLAPLLLGAASLDACATANTAPTTATAKIATAANAVGAAVQATGAAVTSLIYVPPREGPDALRTKMETLAGPAHFANPQLVAGRGMMQTTRSEFGKRRDLLVSSPFVAARAQFRSGKGAPHSGPVLGSGAGDSATTLALLAAAAQSGVPYPLVQPVLAQLLPGFGY